MSYVSVKQGIIKPFPNQPWFLHICSANLRKNTETKLGIARNEQFLIFPHHSLPSVNSQRYDEFLALTELKAFEEDSLSVALIA